MTTINKYIVKTFFSNLIIYFGIISTLFLISYIYQIINPILTHKPSLFTVLKLLIFLFPSIITISLPTTFLLSIMLTFSTLNETNELTILHTMGINKIFYTKNIVFISLIFTFIIVYFNCYIVPKSYRNFKKTYFNFVIAKPYLRFTDNSITSFENKKIYVSKVESTDNLKNVFIYNTISNITQTIYAESSKVYTDMYDNIIFHLFNGKITNLDFNNIYDTTNIKFSEYIFVIPNKQTTKFITATKTLRELTNKEILNEFFSSTSKKYKKTLLTEFFLRYTLAFSIFFFTLLGINIALKIKRNAKSLSFLTTSFILLFYYFILSFVLTFIDRTLENTNFLLIGTLMQIPNILTFVLAFFVKLL